MSVRDIGPFREQILSVYREAFAQPPYYETEADVAAFAERLRQHEKREGFRCVVAHDGVGLLGFAYGYHSLPGQHWHDLIRRSINPALAQRWLSDAFEFVEFAVDPRA